MEDKTFETAVILLCLALFPLCIMWLWNWLMPAIFGLITINYWKALGLLCLCSLLFKSRNYAK